ncbi:distal tail protein [Proteus phage Saba]|uniref:Distal tail protein n=1 Tax=Proteus phage Saba TaxID=2596672 RepID=A0A5B9N9F2_9CAUD|nr:tail assembly protein [Proteus phage Saba]QEG09425.1 distal tail protein [Proteus phage Saba]
MALTGIRPLKETNREGLAPIQSAALSGAYQIFVQDEYEKPDANRKYYASRWQRLEAGEYTVRIIMKGYGGLSLEGNTIFDNVSNGGVWTTPATEKFTIRENAVLKLDLWYVADSSNESAYVIYEIRDAAGGLVDVSRANEFIGDLAPVDEADLPPRPPYISDKRLNLPVFLLRPNRKDGVAERLSWLTDVLESYFFFQAEDGIRDQPRQSLDASFTSHGNNRNILDAFLSGVGQNVCLVPLWYDEETIENDLPVSSVDIFGDFKDVEVRINDVVLIRSPHDIFEYEVNVVKSYNDTQIELATGLQNSYPSGSTVTPLRQARVNLSAGVTSLTNRVMTTQLSFEMIDNPTIIAKWDTPSYARTGLRVFDMNPNYREISFTYDTMAQMFDPQIGKTSFAYPGGQSKQWERMGFHIHGRAEMRKFKAFLQEVGGKWKSFHVPTLRDEFELAEDIRANDGALRVIPSGYSLYGQGEQNGRKDIVIELYSGEKIFNTIISSRTMKGVEWLFLSETLPNISKSEVYRVSFMPESRLDIDSVEFRRVTDSRGVSTVTLVFVNIPRGRKV